MDPWPSKLMGRDKKSYAVTKKPIQTSSKLIGPINLVLHTTEGSDDEGALSTFVTRQDPPTFTLDEDSIYQTRSMDEWAAALRHSNSCPFPEGPNAHAIQIEIATKSQTTPWTLPQGTYERLLAVMVYAARYHGIPLIRPNRGWKDDGSDITTIWASHNTRRQWAEKPTPTGYRYPDQRGVWQHLEVPWQDTTWHWDCGALNISQVTADAKALLDKLRGEDDTMAMDPRLTDDMIADLKALHNFAQVASRDGGDARGMIDRYNDVPLDASKGPFYKHGWFTMDQLMTSGKISKSA